MKKAILLSTLGLIYLLACSSNDIENRDSEWLISSDEVFDGGPGKDGIPSVDNPEFKTVDQTTFLDPDDLVIGIVHNGVAKAYAHRILDWHEIVNDQIADRYLALTYCPLTGTAIAWNRKLDSGVTTFGVSGKLYNTNLIPYDRETDSYWSQLRLDCVNGELISTKIETFPVIETTWNTWKNMYPNSSIMTLETGFNRNYSNYPYGDYRTNHSNFNFPVNNEDNRLPAKDRVLALLSETQNKVYPIDEFNTGRVVTDDFDNGEILVLGSNTRNFLTAYHNDGLENVSYLSGSDEIVAEDSNGNKISISGEVVEGPMAGKQLIAVESILGYYFALAAFYPEIEIFQ